MQINDKRLWRDRFQQLERNEQQRLLQSAKQLRRELLRRTSTSRRDTWDEDVPVRRTPSIEELALDILARQQAELSGKLRLGAPLGTGTVVWVASSECRVSIDGTTYACGLSNALERALGNPIAVGDQVDCRTIEDRHWVTKIHPRRTRLARPDVDNPGAERVIAANIDAIVIVVSVTAPPLHPRLIDRYLIAVQQGGAKPIICVNKIDLLEDSTELNVLDAYRRAGIEVVTCSAYLGDTLAPLHDAIENLICAFVGHSGVGKSSLVNALCPEIGATVGDLMSGYGRGAHTTTASSLYSLPNGAQVIDTPGIRSFGLERIDPGQLGWFFPEFEEASENCKFRDCTHSHEPKCGVRDAVELGLISDERYDTYLRLLDEMG
ncbi:MAG: putative ribosome biogenesis GTPase RsgA [Fimbriimonadaceae bacterium]|nr:putative ribosome biogenesis GTPase RsgA [Fimbriimonadaceae bacterium]